MKKKLLFLAIFIVLGVFIVGAFNAIKTNKKNAMPIEGNYKTINEVSGVSFAINSFIVNKATAVSEISDKINIDPSLMYIYKDGGNKYILFGMDSIAIAVERGTKFELHKEMTDEDIEGSSVAGMWFEKNGNKLQMEYDNNSMTMQVNGGLNISNETYADYVGKIRILTDGETQWAIFCGIPGDGKYKDLSEEARQSIDTIVGSLDFSDYVSPVTEEVYAVTIGDADLSSNSDNAENEDIVEALTESPEDDLAENAIESTTEDIKNELNDDTVSVGAEEIKIEESSEDMEIASTEEPAKETFIKEPVENEEESYIADEPEITVSKETPLVMDNQKKVMNKKNSEAYSSDIYSMLSLKDNGIIVEFDPNTKQIVYPIINVARVYKGKTAVEMIKDYCKETGYYEYFEAPVGCEWHVAEYSLLYKDCSVKPYINIKLRGMDGNNIVYKGIPYSKRTYDMFNKAEWNGDYYGTCYCFYAVPIGVTEYCLECGLGTVEYNTNSRAAYYKVSY